jgi:hypothetical protein
MIHQASVIPQVFKEAPGLPRARRFKGNSAALGSMMVLMRDRRSWRGDAGDRLTLLVVKSAGNNSQIFITDFINHAVSFIDTPRP